MSTTELIVVPHFEEEVLKFGGDPSRIVVSHEGISTSRRIAEMVGGATVLSASVTSDHETGIVLVLLVQRDD